MSIIVQSRLPFAPWMSPVTARLPGVQPVVGPWLAVDDAYAGQMARRDQLIAKVPQEVLTTLPEGQEAAAELYAMLLDLVRQMPGFRIGTVEAERPDGQVVALDAGDPLRTLGRLVQEDLCLLQKQGDEHVLTGAVLCFPASWSLQEKIGRPLIGIHRPVETYDADIARRVQRMFDALRPDQPLWRMNALVYANPELHQPRREDDPRSDRRGGQFLRAERQTLLRLPRTGAVLFAIHTYVVPLSALSEPERQGLDAARL
ncbi:MAG: DUF3445 domain-containing protein [Candidatus Saccharibacteria bacterium]|nr:DUF3445 domain-containing protein [Pseudorhodobacter sp.]